MKGYDMYCEIQQLKERGYSQRQASEELSIHRNTVKRYWNMSVDDFEKKKCKIDRKYKLDSHRNHILDWLTNHPGISSAQICDWLIEHYGESYKERTVSRYVHALREENNIPKKAPESLREYEAVPELPMGKQMQADFGMQWMTSTSGRRIKVYFAAFVLSHSRHKYVDFLSKPFTTLDFVNAAKRCFRYFSGIPEELVIDQDSILSVSENYGDIIYTYDFEQFRQEFGFNVYLCRKNDPESKGKIENVVQYVKKNFLPYRYYPGEDDVLNELAQSWLERTANAKPHGTTKKVPKTVWEIERDYLNPLPAEFVESTEYGMVRSVRKDNTILYCSNRYSVPTWVHNTGSDVEVKEKDGNLIISLPTPDGFVCSHKLLVGRGGLSKNTNHSRDTNQSVTELQEKLREQFAGEIDDFLATIRAEKRRYARDQFNLIETCIDKYGIADVSKAIAYCTHNQLFSATMVRDYLVAGIPSADATPATQNSGHIPRENEKYHVKAAKRSISTYAEIGGNV